MVTFSQFLGLINLILMALYAYEIWAYFHCRKKYPEVFAHFKATDPDFWNRMSSDQEFGGAFTFIVTHATIVCILSQAVVLPFIALCCGALYCSTINSAIKPLIRNAKARTDHQQASQDAEAKQKQKAHSDDGFGFDPGRFGGDPSWSTGQAEADYENALREAQKWVDDAKSETTIRGAIKIFEKKSSDPKVHPKDKLRYKLSIMMLKEKLKKFEAGASPLEKA